MKNIFVIYAKKIDDVIFDLRFFDFLRIVQENERHFWNHEEILDKKHLTLN